ncbi:MAG TPA: hypothetical protein VE710_02920 [Candidatus Bathyarchaeia archaeon]|nr:hypothetical protein [Candidatus Bathyarchaeia archaeon]
MDIHTHAELLDILQRNYQNQEAEITFTEWDGDSEDETVSTFRGTLLAIQLNDNEFDEKDLLLTIQTDKEELELLMEIPADEADLGSYEDGRLQIFGTESEVSFTR